MGGSGITAGMVAMGGGGGLLDGNAGWGAGRSHATQPNVMAPGADLFAGLGGLEGGSLAAAAGGAPAGMLGGGSAREGAGMGSSLGAGVRGGSLLDAGESGGESGISAFGALLNPAPPLTAPEVRYDWALPPPTLAAVGAAAGAQPREVHVSASTGITTVVLAGSVGEEPRLLLQFREETRGGGAAGLQGGAVRYRLPAQVRVEFRGDAPPAPSADGWIPLPPLPWPRGVTHVLGLSGSPLPAGGEQLMRLHVTLSSKGSSDAFEVSPGPLPLPPSLSPPSRLG